MDYDVSISIGTTADLSGLNKAQQAVDGLAKAAGKVPGSLLSGGVGGTTAPDYTGAATGGGMSWRLDGAAGQECILVVPEHQHAYFPARQAASLGQQYNAVLGPIQRRPAKP